MRPETILYDGKNYCPAIVDNSLSCDLFDLFKNYFGHYSSKLFLASRLTVIVNTKKVNSESANRLQSNPR